MDRRDFMKFGAALATGAAGATLLPGTAWAQSSSGLAGKLAAFARQIRGRVILPSDSGYGMAAPLANAQFDSVRPAAIVVTADEGDVASAVAFAREENVDFVLRNGGHSFAGYSTTPGIVIDVSSLTTVRADPERATVAVGAGMTNLPLYEALWPHKMVVPGGTCPTVGITGLALGGGFGRLSPLHGLTSDNLLGVRMVTADGEIVTADARENADLYWACRGGGGGNFGVVTELHFRLQPADMPFTEIQYTFAREAVPAVLRAWQDWIQTFPRGGHSELQVVTGAPTADGGVTLDVNLTFAGDPERGKAIAAELPKAAGFKPTDTKETTGGYVSTERDWICAGLKPDECMLEGLTPHGKLSRSAIYIESDFVFEPWPDEGLDRIIDAIDRRQADRRFTPEGFDASTQVGKFLLESCGGAINDTAPDATAFPHRGMLYLAQYQSRWRPGSDQATVDANVEWTRGMYEAVADYRSGASYVNYIDANLADWQRAYYGDNLARLRQIKTKFDPDNIFRFPQSIPPA